MKLTGCHSHSDSSEEIYELLPLFVHNTLEKASFTSRIWLPVTRAKQWYSIYISTRFFGGAMSVFNVAYSKSQ